MLIFFVSFFEGTKRLVLSFINNPYSASKRKDNELTVWVNHPRQYIEIMQSLIDQEYDGDLRSLYHKCLIKINSF